MKKTKCIHRYTSVSKSGELTNRGRPSEKEIYIYQNEMEGHKIKTEKQESALKLWLFKIQYYMYILGGYNTYPQLKKKKNKRQKTNATKYTQ